MGPAPMQFAKIAKDHVVTNPFTITSPTVFVTETDTQCRRNEVLQLGESTAAILAAMATSKDIPGDPNGVSKSRSKRNRRKNRKKRKNLAEHTVNNASRAHGRNAGRKNKKRNSTTATTTSGRGRKWRARSETPPHPEGVPKILRRSLRLSEKRRVRRRKALEEAVDGLAGLMEGFGICTGEMVQEERIFGGGQEGMEMDMDGLERKMAMLEVMRGGGGEIIL